MLYHKVENHRLQKIPMFSAFLYSVPTIININQFAYIRVYLSSMVLNKVSQVMVNILI